MGTKLEMWMSPLSNRIYVGRTRADRLGRVATSSQDVTAQCINGAVSHLVAIGELDVIVTGEDGNRYRVKIAPENPAATTPVKPARQLVHCAAARDGECAHERCPQLRDGEPAKSGRHCPLDNRGAD